MSTIETATAGGDPLNPKQLRRSAVSTPKVARTPSNVAAPGPLRSDADKARQKAALEKLLRDIDTSIDEANKANVSGQSRRKSKAHIMVRDLRDRFRHRSDLKRARKAAQKAFGVRSRPSGQKRAALMMGLGAMTLSTVAATGPDIRSKSVPVIQDASVDATRYRVHAAKISASDAFKQALIEEEGVRQTVYRDVAGYPTVGVGHLVRSHDGLNVGDRISYDQVLDFLEDDLAIAEEGVRRLVGDLPIYQHEFDALLDLVYNVGEGNVSERKSPRLNAAIEAGDYESIADELHYHHAAGKKARGLEFRSERRAAMFEQASYEDPRET
jgi:GH24 family phage-related lysozyme (muramidase)